MPVVVAVIYAPLGYALWGFWGAVAVFAAVVLLCAEEAE